MDVSFAPFVSGRDPASVRGLDPQKMQQIFNEQFPLELKDQDTHFLKMHYLQH